MRSSVPILTAFLVLCPALPAGAEDAAGTVASLNVRSTLKQLVEGGEGQVFLVVTNTSPHSIWILDVLSFDHPFVSVERRGEAIPVEIPPRQSHAIPFDVKAKKDVETGEQLLLWQVDLAWNEGSVPRRGRLLTEATFQTKVMGESEVLDALQVPSLLLLPGVLILLLFPKLEAGRYRFFRVPGERHIQKNATLAESVKDVLRPERVVIAVLSSLTLIFFYQLFKPRFPVRHGLIDVYYLCLLSLGAAFLLCLGKYGVLQGKRIWRQRRTLSDKDGPVEALFKLARRGGRSIVLPQLDKGFVLAEDETGLWTVPPIRIDDRAVTALGLRDRLEALLETGRPDTLARFFQVHRELQPRWKQDGPRHWKRSLAAQAVRRQGRRLVEI